MELYSPLFPPPAPPPPPPPPHLLDHRKKSPLRHHKSRIPMKYPQSGQNKGTKQAYGTFTKSKTTILMFVSARTILATGSYVADAS